VAVAQNEVILERRLQRDLVGGGSDDVVAAPVAFLPPHPTTHIEARVGEAVIFLFFLEWTPSIGQHKPTEVVKVSSTSILG
jgi:hypothetical protein